MIISQSLESTLGVTKMQMTGAMTGDWQNGGDMTIDKCIGICADQVMTFQ